MSVGHWARADDVQAVTDHKTSEGASGCRGEAVLVNQGMLGGCAPCQVSVALPHVR